jgi:hypothetical protein
MSFSFLWEMTWKSALIIVLAMGLAALLRSRSPADRAAVLRLGVSLLLLMPLIALFLPALQIETPAETLVDAGASLPLEPLAARGRAAGDRFAAAGADHHLGRSVQPDRDPVSGRPPDGRRADRGGPGDAAAWTRAARPMTDLDWLRAMARVRPAGRAASASACSYPTRRRARSAGAG